MRLYFKPQQSKILVSLVEKPKLFMGEIPATAKSTKGNYQLDGFKENKDFVEYLNNFLRLNIYKSPNHQAMAAYLKTRHLNINDCRIPEQWGRVCDPEDIFGTVLVQDGKMVPGTFEPMFTHRLHSSNGVFKLDPALAEKLLSDLSN